MQSKPAAPLFTGVSAIAAGLNHSCMLTSTGGVQCWGANDYGQLGDGTLTTHLISDPVDVSGLSSGIIAIAAGGDNTCALTSAGGVKCWGRGSGGRLGNGGFTDKLIPVDVSQLGSGVSALAVGIQHTCALTTDGVVKCWGLNESGQLGDGTTDPKFFPVNVVGVVGHSTPTPTPTPTGTATPTSTPTATPTRWTSFACQYGFWEPSASFSFTSSVAAGLEHGPHWLEPHFWQLIPCTTNTRTN